MNKRQEEILNMLSTEKTLNTAELADRLDVSIVTIRRDINALAQKNLIDKHYGGISARNTDFNVQNYVSWHVRSQNLHEEKVRIGEKALDFVHDDSVIALDIGTTLSEFAKLLYVKKNLVIITNSLFIASNLAQNTDHQIFCIGGTVSSNEVITHGYYASEFLAHFSYVDQFFIGADAISEQSGITETHDFQAEVKSMIGKLAKETILLADHSKFHKSARFKSIDLNSVDKMVTDTGTPEEEINSMKEHGIECYTV